MRAQDWACVCRHTCICEQLCGCECARVPKHSCGDLEGCACLSVSVHICLGAYMHMHMETCAYMFRMCVLAHMCEQCMGSCMQI